MSAVLFERTDRILWVTINRPEARNAINQAVNAELWDGWRMFESDPDLDVAILTGAGDKAFCAGADLSDYIPLWLQRQPVDIRRNVETGLGGLTRGLHRIYKPVIGAINGWALAGGFELALACDVRIASQTARFGSFEIRRGFHHGDGGIVRLMASIGLSRTTDIVLSGREVDAEEAYRIGLVAQVVPPDELRAVAEAYARRLLAHSQTALRSAKETILETIGRSIDDALRLEALYGYTSGDLADVRNRVEAFLSPGKPSVPSVGETSRQA